MSEYERNARLEYLERVFALINAKGSYAEPSKINHGMVIVVDGRTGLDACERTFEDACDVLFREIDGEGSPGRVGFGFANGAPTLAVLPAPAPDAIREALDIATTASRQ